VLTSSTGFTQWGIAIRKRPNAEQNSPIAVQNGLFFTLTITGMAKMKSIWLISFPAISKAVSLDLMPKTCSIVDNVPLW
jgi:hypothetical protein